MVLNGRGREDLTETHKVCASRGCMVKDFKPWWSNCIVGQMSLALEQNETAINRTIVGGGLTGWDFFSSSWFLHQTSNKQSQRNSTMREV